MSIYKRRGRTGKLRRNYTISWRTALGKSVTMSSGTSDKRAAQRILDEKKRRVALILSGAVDPFQERCASEAARPISAHLEEYLGACRGLQAGHALKQKECHLRWLLDVTGAQRLTDILPDALDQQFSLLTESGKSARTVNLKLECANSFLNWCVRNGRLTRNPLKVVPRRNEVVDQRHPRRALSEAESARLIVAARERAAKLHSAKLRPLWYMLPLLAGLRRGDLVNLTWGAVDLDQGVLTIRGGKAKHRVDQLPLHAELLGELRAVKPTCVLPSAPVFPRAVANKTRQEDFKRARIVLVNERGEYADLHALRVTYGTRLALAGVPPAVLQQLMRHCTIELTMKYYTKLSVDDLGKRGIDHLPSLATPTQPKTRTSS